MLEDAKTNQNTFRSDLNEIKKGNPKKIYEQKYVLYNINMLNRSREYVIKF